MVRLFDEPYLSRIGLKYVRRIADVKVYLDGAPLPVTRATLAPSYIGFYLIELQLAPITNLGTSELYLSAGGQESNRVADGAGAVALAAIPRPSSSARDIAPCHTEGI